ncbi:unnamed protein product [Caenorhabditis brenneri]
MKILSSLEDKGLLDDYQKLLCLLVGFLKQLDANLPQYSPQRLEDYMAGVEAYADLTLTSRAKAKENKEKMKESELLERVNNDNVTLRIRNIKTSEELKTLNKLSQQKSLEIEKLNNKLQSLEKLKEELSGELVAIQTANSLNGVNDSKKSLKDELKTLQHKVRTLTEENENLKKINSEVGLEKKNMEMHLHAEIDR